MNAKLLLKVRVQIAALALFGAFACGDDDDDHVSGTPDAAPVTPECAPSRPPRPGALAPVHAPGLGRLPRRSSRPLGPVAHVGYLPAERAAEGPSARRQDLRLLVLAPTGTEPSTEVALSALARLGLPHDLLVTTREELTAARLGDAAEGRCDYAGVVLTVGGLVTAEAEAMASTMSAAEWRTLAEFEHRCEARELVLYGYPEPALGLLPALQFDHTAVVRAQLTDAGRAMFPYLRPEAPLTIRGVWGYGGAVLDATKTTPVIATDDGLALAAVHRLVDGREVLLVTVDSSPYTIHGLLLEYGLLAWTSGDVFLGMRRSYMSPQIDDVLLATDLWGAGGAASYRMVGDDVRTLITWQAATAARLPPGSAFLTEMAFNGAGALAYPEPSLLHAITAAKGAFRWLNHTWDHSIMNAMTREEARLQIERNCTMAGDLALPRFSCIAAVTPAISGLDNPAAVLGLLDAGVRVVVSDASVTPALNALNPGTNPSANVGRENPHDRRLYQVPRHPTNIFFDCSLPAEETSHYNFLYRDAIGRDLSYDEILAAEAELGLFYLLTYDIDPLMFHQANLRFWTDATGRRRSLYTDWVDATLDRYVAHVELPIVSLSLAEIGAAMRARATLDDCQAEATLVSVGGRRTLELRTVSACTVPITGVAAPTVGVVEIYGGVATTHVEMPSCGLITVAMDAP